jgi:hypothetical protein
MCFLVTIKRVRVKIQVAERPATHMRFDRLWTVESACSIYRSLCPYMETIAEDTYPLLNNDR